MAELPEEMASKLVQASDIVLGSEYVVAIVGAGLSVESGIPPYRGPGGLWTKYGEPPMLSYHEFVRDPKLWWEERLQGEVEPGNPIYEMKLSVERAACVIPSKRCSKVAGSASLPTTGFLSFFLRSALISRYLALVIS